MKKLILVDSGMDFKDEGLVIALDEKTEKALEKKGIKHKKKSDYNFNVKIDRELALSIRSWFFTDFQGKTFMERFNYKELAMSWIIEDLLLESPFFYCETILNYFEIASLLSDIIKKEKPDEIYLYSKDIDAINVVSSLGGIVNGKKTGPISYKTGIRKKIVWKMSNIRKKSRWLLWKSIPGKKKIRADILAFTTKKIKDKNVIEDVQEKMKNKHIIKIIHFSGRKTGFREMISWAYGGRYQPGEAYFTWRGMKRADKTKKEMEREWFELKKHEEFRGIFKYKGISVWPIVENVMDFFFSRFLYRVLLEMEAYEEMIKRENPRLIVHNEAPTMQGRELIAIAHINKVPDLALQHGLMGNITTRYLERDNVGHKFGLPIPDKKAVYGYYHKRFLIENSKYPADSIIITGDPQYDILSELLNNLDKDKIRKELGIKKGNKILTFGTTIDPHEKERMQVPDIIFKEASKIKNLSVIVKFHPREEKEEEIKKIAERYGIENIVFLKNYNVVKILFISDYFVCTASSLITEAIMIGVPSMIMDIYGRNYWELMAERSKTIINVAKEEDFGKALKKINSKEFMKKWKKEQKKFVYDFFFKLDGKASERTSHLIEKMI